MVREQNIWSHFHEMNHHKVHFPPHTISNHSLCAIPTVWPWTGCYSQDRSSLRRTDWYTCTKREMSSNLRLWWGNSLCPSSGLHLTMKKIIKLSLAFIKQQYNLIISWKHSAPDASWSDNIWFWSKNTCGAVQWLAFNTIINRSKKSPGGLTTYWHLNTTYNEGIRQPTT